jgi:hypothetical protein
LYPNWPDWLAAVCAAKSIGLAPFGDRIAPADHEIGRIALGDLMPSVILGTRLLNASVEPPCASASRSGSARAESGDGARSSQRRQQRPARHSPRRDLLEMRIARIAETAALAVVVHSRHRRSSRTNANPSVA